MSDLQLPAIVSVDMDLTYGRKTNDPDRGGAECVLRRVRDHHGPDNARIFDIRDFRPEGERFAGSSAKLTVLPTNSLLILESASDPAAASSVRLVFSTYSGTHGWGGVHDDGALWCQNLTSTARLGRIAGGTVIALVDDDHVLAVKQGHMVVRYGLIGPSLDPAHFEAPTGQVRPVIRIPNHDLYLAAAEAAATAQGLSVCSSHTDTYIYPEALDSGWHFPTGLGTGFFWLEAFEAGGKLGNVGHAVVICGPKGERLPYFRNQNAGSHEPCGTHASFVTAGPLVSVHAFWPAAGDVAYVTIRQHTLAVNAAGIQVQFANLLDQWAGDPDLMPTDMTQFSEAVKAAVRKAGMEGCDSVVYAKGVP